MLFNSMLVKEKGLLFEELADINRKISSLLTKEQDKILYSIGVNKLYVVMLLSFCILVWGFMWFLHSDANASYKKFSMFLMFFVCVAFVVASMFFTRDVREDRKEFEEIATSIPFRIYVESYELFWRDSNQLFSQY